MDEPPTEQPVPPRRRWLASGELRSLSLEMLTVLLGILIALFVNEAVSNWHRRQNATEARAVIREEMQFNRSWYVYRRATAHCIARRLDIYDDRVELLAQRKQLTPLQFDKPGTGAALRDQAWAAAVSSGIVADFPFTEQRELGTFYSQQSEMRGWMGPEGDDWIVLNLANKPADTLSLFDVSRMRTAVQSARRYLALTRRNADRQIDRLNSLGIASASQGDQRLAAMMQFADKTCAEVGLNSAWAEAESGSRDQVALHKSTAAAYEKPTN